VHQRVLAVTFASMAQSNLDAKAEPIVFRIIPEATCPGVTIDTKTLTAAGILLQGFVELASGTLTIHNEILSDREKRDNIQWFLEKHATNDPFAITRADQARRMLKKFSLHLAKDISQLDGFVKRSDSTLKIEFHCPAEGTCPLASLPWEILEDKLPWAFAGVFHKEYLVERVVDLKQNVQGSSAQGSTLGGKLNILMVTARPQNNADIDSGQVSWPVAKIISKYPGARNSANLRLVRPGSLNALKKELGAKEKGFYQLVHLDMHGQVEGDQ
jgi:hypothetical protein